MSAVIYCRASTREQDESCDQQEAACHKRAKQLGLQVMAMTDVLGVNPVDPQWNSAMGYGGNGVDDARTALDALVQDRIQARSVARSARDFTSADQIRDQLTAAGIVVEDTASGARWSLTRRTDA